MQIWLYFDLEVGNFWAAIYVIDTGTRDAFHICVPLNTNDYPGTPFFFSKEIITPFSNKNNFYSRILFWGQFPPIL